jgi:hypothetical protein
VKLSTILYVENNDNYVFFLRRAWIRAGFRDQMPLRLSVLEQAGPAVWVS